MEYESYVILSQTMSISNALVKAAMLEFPCPAGGDLAQHLRKGKEDLLKAIFSLLPILLPLLVSTFAYAETPEYRIKSAMLANFALFVEWPPSAYSATDNQFVVCIVGTNPFGSWLKQEMGDRIGDRPVAVRTVSDGAAAKACSMVFISESEQQRLNDILASLRNLPVLTVTDVEDTSGFCRLGGMIGLVMREKKVRFELNSEAASKAGLKIDSKLKRIAQSTDCGK